MTHRHAAFRITSNTALAALALAGLLTGTSAHAAWQTPSIATIAAADTAPVQNVAPGITTTVSNPNPFYKITAQDVSAAVAEQLQAEGVVPKAEVILNAGTPSILYSSDHALKVAIHTLQVDPTSKRWQAQAYFLSNGKTESVKPIAGTFGTLIEVPVLSRQFSRTDVIEEKDITLLAVPERLLRKDTVTDAKALIGQSPRNGISPNRPIRTAEVTAPIVIKKGDLVEMAYNTPYIHIKTTGVALEDGAKGATIRVKNQKSQHAVTANVVAAGRVEVAGDSTL